MTWKTYHIDDFLTIESEFEIFLFDIPPEGGRENDPDMTIRQVSPATIDSQYSIENNGNKLDISLSSDCTTTKTDSSVPDTFTKLLLSGMQYILLENNATIGYAAALKSPQGKGCMLIGGSGSGKSAASFLLADRHDFQILSDDFVIFKGNEILSFPRHLELPRDVDPVNSELQKYIEGKKGEIREWSDEIDIPRRFISEVPDSITPEVVVFINPVRSSSKEGYTPINSRKGASLAIERNQTNLDNWTEHPKIVENFGGSRRELRSDIIRTTVEQSSCYFLKSKKSNIPDKIANRIDG